MRSAPQFVGDPIGTRMHHLNQKLPIEFRGQEFRGQHTKRIPCQTRAEKCQDGALKGSGQQRRKLDILTQELLVPP